MAVALELIEVVLVLIVVVVVVEVRLCEPFVCIRRRQKPGILEKTSLSSCSDTNCPKLATNSVEQGAFAANGGFDGCAGLFEEPTGLAKAGLDKK